MIEIDGKPAEGLHVIISHGNNLSWDDENQHLIASSDVTIDELSPTEFNRFLENSDRYIIMQAINTKDHDFVLVIGDAGRDW